MILHNKDVKSVNISIKKLIEKYKDSFNKLLGP